ncbi:MAG: 50S ribosomal protein L18 [Candidatus Magasanikbacteria bacterium RIFCSPHIGHO2_01_FULL_33_34]|uniref:Large ribosomal subunit protein uL18 n=1 Tax=Candidatus Magasanikbacteria bacterium RIFCSPHIGHO2_01_FULL_33_34 TaxID=1798671 RepID=A0A1F6LLJ7_9BACT|nr:MAG: 50S ribosomal protein L18 [Candidatus Magasanikbacteria bacterium RIFCSPHIGHO2_01_FULL_33_34]OGH65985.1 MAG: 50S ribosomal protein L18 [Candidatus Magasanikbacteria bacterium RIFCSPHIGHO2_02_FULL_33_17]OGH76380.1 MAG: 50S ribosomal protein L18 [Candidatus Magasanikbacteria bacterium RIFCSPLOWO2_01_FULL_33_34]OGH81486.1 MAG: 50S ribosomal protein L18 [Candidatus Magasanikbacteria bacterium RIFCSPLOWO2_12_FULL_34_7]
MKNSKITMKNRRKARIRAKISGTTERPRLHVTKTLTGLYLQVINDEIGKTLVSANVKKDIDKKGNAGDRKGKVAQGYLLGIALGKKAIEAGVTKVVFDRGGNRYHGRIKAVAEGAREAGLIL